MVLQTGIQLKAALLSDRANYSLSFYEHHLVCGKRGGKATENSVDTVKRNACSVCLLQAAGPLFVCPCQSKGPLFSEIFYLKDSPV